jgi:hypothetical protein
MRARHHGELHAEPAMLPAYRPADKRLYTICILLAIFLILQLKGIVPIR